MHRLYPLVVIVNRQSPQVYSVGGAVPALTIAQWLDLAVSALLPALVALITAQNAHPGLKSAVLFGLSTLSGSLSTALEDSYTGQELSWNTVGITVLLGFATATVAHYGALRPMNITGSAGRIATRFPKGLGASHGKHEKP
jgi:hypothetical protein